MTSSPRWERVEEIFHVAREQPPENRSSFLNAACEGDVQLRRVVEALLEEDHAADTSAGTAGTGLLTITLAPGTTLGPYQIVNVAGIGGMGQVYRAKDSRLKREVAIKALPPHLALDTRRLTQFEREATLLASLNHPNVGTIYDIIDGGEARYLVLEFVEGVTLDERLKKGPLSIQEVLENSLQIAKALEASALRPARS